MFSKKVNKIEMSSVDKQDPNTIDAGVRESQILNYRTQGCLAKGGNLS